MNLHLFMWKYAIRAFCSPPNHAIFLQAKKIQCRLTGSRQNDLLFLNYLHERKHFLESQSSISCRSVSISYSKYWHLLVKIWQSSYHTETTESERKKKQRLEIQNMQSGIPLTEINYQSWERMIRFMERKRFWRLVAHMKNF